MVKAFSPDEARKAKATLIPNEVIEAFNELIALSLENEIARVSQHELLNLIERKFHQNNKPLYHRNDIIEKGWLNIEPLYEDAGWEVTYDRPGMGESYEANWTLQAVERRKD
jgi:hypothetical protein